MKRVWQEIIVKPQETEKQIQTAKELITLVEKHLNLKLSEEA